MLVLQTLSSALVAPKRPDVSNFRTSSVGCCSWRDPPDSPAAADDRTRRTRQRPPAPGGAVFTSVQSRSDLRLSARHDPISGCRPGTIRVRSIVKPTRTTSAAGAIRLAVVGSARTISAAGAMFTSLLQLRVAEVRRMLGTGDRRWRGRRPSAGLVDGAAFASIWTRRFQLVPLGRSGTDDALALAARLPLDIRAAADWRRQAAAGWLAGPGFRPCRLLSCRDER